MLQACPCFALIPASAAWVALEAFLALPQVDVIEQSAPKRWMDAYVAAFAMAAGVVLVSLDRDFSRFEQQDLKFQHLLADGSGCKVIGTEPWSQLQPRI